MKILAVDYGGKRVGLASGDSDHGLAFPKSVISRSSDEQVVKDILQVCIDEGYEAVVFGLPLDMDDGKGVQYELTRKFIDGFISAVAEKGIDLQVEVVDERLSSFEADQYLEDFKGEKVRKADGDRDMMSAKVILERYFAGLTGRTG